MTFLSPIFLAAAGAAIIPLVLHLIARRKRVRVPFSTIRFLRLAQKQSSAKSRMENLLLWLLRTLLLLLLAFAFAKPVAQVTGHAGLLGTARRDVAIVWDASYSMAYEEGGRSVWDASRDAVISIIRGLNKGDRVTIFLAADPVTPLIAEPTSDLDFAISAVKAEDFRYTSSNLNDAAVAALDSLRGRNEHELYIVTDGQAKAWEGFHAPQGMEDTPVFVCLLGARSPVNTAPVAVEAQPPLIMADTSPQLLVTIGHTGAAQQSSVAITVDDHEIVRRGVDLPENGGYNLTFTIPPMPPGTHALRVSTPDDPLSLDNDYLMLLKVRQNLPVLVAGSQDDAFFIEHALAPSDATPVHTRRIDPALLATEPLDDFPCVFLVNALPLPGQAIVALQDYVHRGGVVAIFPGDRATPEDYNAFACLPAPVQRIADNMADPQREPLVLLQPLDPLFAGLKMPAGVSPSIAVERRLVFGKMNADAKALIGASSENPFLLSRNFGAGRVLVFSVSADRQWSDLPLSPFFLPLAHQAVRLACGIGQDHTQVRPASGFVLSDIVSTVPDGSTLIAPDRTTLPIRKVQKPGHEGDYELLVDRLAKPGYYLLAKPGSEAPQPIMAVNVDRAESDLKPIAPETIPTATGLRNISIATSIDEMLRQIQEHRVGRPLSELALWAVLALSLAELYFANRACRRHATLSESISVAASGRVTAAAATS